ncbi:response regulator [Aquisalimonas asiatica]|uniref:DNA-binding response regulator, NarL/FixJ family, contains REC and HTH domains n=1 Tax=Aquisalimonas asiatica TaxID=406100 RepID=A0A1H8QDI5_9GAMM|nr:response regulator transcription factor [Aquisalimonas asiatica]SEO52300.1 DNA-binding response regulator, NarL/FixJ family, contains REC and HTH domains [Aquisalimonas asiatica]
MQHQRQQSGRIRVLVAGGHQLPREGICRILEGQERVDVIAEASRYATMEGLVVTTTLDVVVMDIGLPGWDRTSLPKSSQGCGRQDRPAYVVMSVPPTIEAVARTLYSGATGFLLKDAGHRELEDGVYSAGAGETFMCPTMLQAILSEFLRHLDPENDNGPLPELGNVDRSILNRLEQGDTAPAIAQSLGVHDQTVMEHRRRIMAHLDVENSDGLLLAARRTGLLSTDAMPQHPRDG